MVSRCLKPRRRCSGLISYFIIRLLQPRSFPPRGEFGILVKRPCAMPDHSVHKAGDLARDERLLVERWLGRRLSNDETISVNAYRPHSAPTGYQREILRREILTQAREIGSRVQDPDEREVDA